MGVVEVAAPAAAAAEVALLALKHTPRCKRTQRSTAKHAAAWSHAAAVSKRGVTVDSNGKWLEASVYLEHYGTHMLPRLSTPNNARTQQSSKNAW